MRALTLLLLPILGSTSLAQPADSLATRRPQHRTEHGAVRFLASWGGAALIGSASAIVAQQASTRSPEHCRSDCLDLHRMLYWGITGAVFGAAAGAALPTLSSECDMDRRLTRSLIGAGIGALAGYAISFGISEGALGATVPLGAMVGSTVAVHRCRSQ